MVARADDGKVPNYWSKLKPGDLLFENYPGIMEAQYILVLDNGPASVDEKSNPFMFKYRVELLFFDDNSLVDWLYDTPKDHISQFFGNLENDHTLVVVSSL